MRGTFPWTKKKAELEHFQTVCELRERDKADKEKVRQERLKMISLAAITATEITETMKAAIAPKVEAVAAPPAPRGTGTTIVNNNFNNSQVIQGSPGAIQHVTISDSNLMEVIDKVIPILNDIAKGQNFDSVLVADLLGHIQMLEAQRKVSTKDPVLIKRILTGVWNQIKTIPANVSTSLAVEALKSLLGIVNLPQ